MAFGKGEAPVSLPGKIGHLLFERAGSDGYLTRHQTELLELVGVHPVIKQNAQALFPACNQTDRRKHMFQENLQADSGTRKPKAACGGIGV